MGEGEKGEWEMVVAQNMICKGKPNIFELFGNNCVQLVIKRSRPNMETLT